MCLYEFYVAFLLFHYSLRYRSAITLFQIICLMLFYSLLLVCVEHFYRYIVKLIWTLLCIGNVSVSFCGTKIDFKSN